VSKRKLQKNMKTCFIALLIPFFSLSLIFLPDIISSSPATNKLNSKSSKLIFDPAYSYCNFDCGHNCFLTTSSEGLKQKQKTRLRKY
jgi:hypothetical protein